MPCSDEDYRLIIVTGEHSITMRFVDRSAIMCGE